MQVRRGAAIARGASSFPQGRFSFRNRLDSWSPMLRGGRVIVAEKSHCSAAPSDVRPRHFRSDLSFAGSPRRPEIGSWWMILPGTTSLIPVRARRARDGELARMRTGPFAHSLQTEMSVLASVALRLITVHNVGDWTPPAVPDPHGQPAAETEWCRRGHASTVNFRSERGILIFSTLDLKSPCLPRVLRTY